MKLAVVGSRTFDNYELLDFVLGEQYEIHEGDLTIISGGARGADSLAKRWAEENGIGYVEFKPDWNKHGRAAGIIRNTDIIENSDQVVAFWDGRSRGTHDSIMKAVKAGKFVMIQGFNE